MHDARSDDTETILRDQLDPVLRWLTEGGDPWEMDLAYWHRRDVDRHNRMRLDALRILSHIDVTLDAFDPSLPGPHSITEPQMRSEVLGYIADLQRLGYLSDWSLT
jgi:hypothetical protein